MDRALPGASCSGDEFSRRLFNGLAAFEKNPTRHQPTESHVLAALRDAVNGVRASRSASVREALGIMAECSKAAPGSSGRIINAAIPGLVVALGDPREALTLRTLRKGFRGAVRAAEGVLKEAYNEAPNPGGLVYALIEIRDAVDQCETMAQVPGQMAEAVRHLASVDPGSYALSVFLDGFAGSPGREPIPLPPFRPRILRKVYDGLIGHVDDTPNKAQRLVAKAVGDGWSMPIFYDRSLESYILYVQRRWMRQDKPFQGLVTVPGSLAGCIVTARGERNWFDPKADMRVELAPGATNGEREIVAWVDATLELSGAQGVEP